MCFIFFTLSLSAAQCEIIQLRQCLLSQCFAQGPPRGHLPCLGALHTVDRLFSNLYLFFLSLSGRSSHLVSVGRPSWSYLSQADVLGNHDLQVWLLGNGSLAPVLIGNLQSREGMVKVGNTSSSLVPRSTNLLVAIRKAKERVRGLWVRLSGPWHSSDGARQGQTFRDGI